jgi:hypothetical protein
MENKEKKKKAFFPDRGDEMLQLWENWSSETRFQIPAQGCFVKAEICQLCSQATNT